MRLVKAHSNQSIFDLAIQHCGSVEAVYDIALINDLPIDAQLVTGQVLGMPEVFNRKVVDELAAKGVIPANAYRPETRLGMLYNFWAYTSPNGIASLGWALISNAIWDEIIAYHAAKESNLGGALREVGYEWWDAPNAGATNEYNFSARGTGIRGSNGLFSPYRERMYMGTGDTVVGGCYYKYTSYHNDVLYSGTGDKRIGVVVRLYKQTLTPAEEALNDGEYGPDYIGNNKIAYKTVKIGGYLVTAENLRETKFRNGDTIPIVESNAQWSLNNIPAMCAPNNDIRLV